MTKKLLVITLVMAFVAFMAVGVFAVDKAAPTSKKAKNVSSKVMEYVQATNQTLDDVAIYFADFEGPNGDWTPQNNGAGDGFVLVDDNYHSANHSWWLADDQAMDAANAAPINASIVSPPIELPTDLDGEPLNQIYVSYWFDADNPNTAPGDGYVYDVFESHVEAPFPGANLWHTTTLDAYEGMSWFCGSDASATYTDNTRQELRSPTMDISAPSGAVMLNFKNFDSIEDDFDYGYVEVSSDGGASWVTLDVYSTERAAVAYSDASYDISAYVTDQTAVRFRFESDGGYQSPWGWHLDNIEVKDDATTYLFDDGGDTQTAMTAIVHPFSWQRMQYDYDRGGHAQPTWLLQDESSIFNGSLDVTHLAGLTVRFAIVMTSDGWNRAGLASGRGFYVDDFGVWGVGKPPADLEAVSIVDPCFVKVGESFKFELNVANVGTEAQSAFTWQGRVTNAAGSPVGSVVGSFSGTLEPDAMVTVPALTGWTPPAPGAYSLVAWTRLPGDIVSANDTTNHVEGTPPGCVQFYVSAEHLIFASQLNDLPDDETTASLRAEGFAVQSNGDEGVVTWQIGSELWSPGSYGIDFRGAEIYFDSLGRYQDEELIIPDLDFSYITSGAQLNFYGMGVAGFSWTNFSIRIVYPCCPEQSQLLFERNGGVDPVTGQVYSGPSFFRANMRPANIDITPFVAGRKGVCIHFRYRAIDDGDWCLAKVAVSGNGLKAANLVSAKDVDPDQGYKVRLTWNASINDGFLQGVPIVEYGLWAALAAGEMGDNVVKVKNLSEMISTITDSKVEAGTQFLNTTDSQGWLFLDRVLPLGNNQTVYHRDVTVPQNDVNYDFMVSAHTASGLVANSNIVKGMAKDNLPPAVPGNFAMVEENYKVKLSWNEPINEEPAFYSIYRSGTSGVYGEAIATVTGLNFEADYVSNEVYFRVTATDYAGNESAPTPELVATSLRANTNAVPTEYAVSQNYPNPFNPTTNIMYQLPEKSDVKLVILNSLGQEVRTLVNGEMSAGYHTITWNGCDNSGNIVSNGIYLYQIKAGSFVKTMKMVFMK